MSRVVIETREDEHDALRKLAVSKGRSVADLFRAWLRLALTDRMPELDSELAKARPTLSVTVAGASPALVVKVAPEPETEYEIEMRKRAEGKARLDKFNAERRAKHKG